MALTKYKILRRGEGGKLTELGVHETNGPKQAMRAEVESWAKPDPESSGKIDETLALVAVPEGNWTEQGARVKTKVEVELFDIPGHTPAEPEDEPLPEDGV